MLYVKFRIHKHCLLKHFAFLKNVSYHCLNFVLWVTYCFFMSYWPVHNQLSWNVLLFSCNPIGQLWLSSPGYSSKNARYVCSFIWTQLWTFTKNAMWCTGRTLITCVWNFYHSLSNYACFGYLWHEIYPKNSVGAKKDDYFENCIIFFWAKRQKDRLGI